jgi:superfamily II DNA or RNA helicase
MVTKDSIQDDALAATEGKLRCCVVGSVGVGKTLLGLKHMARRFGDGTFFLVVASKVAIFQSWIDDAQKFGYEYLLPHIRFSTYVSLNKQDLDYDCVYFDEAHNILPSHDEWLASFPNTMLALTGTPPKYQTSAKGKIFYKYFPVVYEYLTDDAVNDGILNDYEIFVHMINLGIIPNVKSGKAPKFFYTTEKANYTYWTKRCDEASGPKNQLITRVMRMKALMTYPSKEQYVKSLLFSMSSTDKVLLFANTQEQADKLCHYSYHSKNSNSKVNLNAFKEGKINELSCVLQISEGVNIPNLKIGIIMHAYGNERKASQRIGRMMRLNPKDKCTIHILCYKDTIDEYWVKTALEDYDQTKITYL